MASFVTGSGGCSMFSAHQCSSPCLFLTINIFSSTYWHQLGCSMMWLHLQFWFALAAAKGVEHFAHGHWMPVYPCQHYSNCQAAFSCAIFPSIIGLGGFFIFMGVTGDDSVGKEYFPQQNEDPSLGPQHTHIKSMVVVRTCHPSAGRLRQAHP